MTYDYNKGLTLTARYFEVLQKVVGQQDAKKIFKEIAKQDHKEKTNG